MLRLLRSGNIWVKLAGADRITRSTGKLLDVLIEAVPEAATRCAILADNPERLYGFGC